MMKRMLLGALLLSAGSAMMAQESRQDISVSAIGVWQPQVNGNGSQLNASMTMGGLVSYRYLVTPRSGLELNYSFSQYTDYFRTSFTRPAVHVRQQEITGAYVYSRNYGNYNPFVEVGVGGYIMSPIRDFGTSSLDTKQNTNIGALFGAGVAYELSPSWDLRVAYRAFVLKAPNSGLDSVATRRYTVISTPAVGFAYHF